MCAKTQIKIASGRQVPDSRAEVAAEAHSLVDVWMQLQRLLLEGLLDLTIVG